MVTGFINIVDEVSEKHLELLLVAVPKLKRIGFLADSKSRIYAQAIAAVRRSAARHSVEVHFADATKPEEIEPAISHFAKESSKDLNVRYGETRPAGWGRVLAFGTGSFGAV